MAMERMLPGCRPAATRSGWSRSATRSRNVARRQAKSAVSRRFVAMTETALAELLSRGPVRAGPGRVDDRRGALRRAPAASSRWASASTAPSTRWRWWRARRRTPPWSPTCWSGCASAAWTSPARCWSCIDGSKALAAGGPRRVRPPGDRNAANCTRSETWKTSCPKRLRALWPSRMADAYHADSALEAEADAGGPGQGTRPDPPRRRGQPARGPGRDAHRAAPRRAAHPGPHAALDERHRVDDLDLPRPRRNVKRWRDGQMALRWCAAGMVEAGKQFRRVNGHLHLPALRAALERDVDRTCRSRRAQ